MSVTIRKARPADLPKIKACVQDTIDDTYGGLWMDPPLPLPDYDWASALIAVDDSRVFGVATTGVDRVENLWVHPEAQGQGIGSRLLSEVEREIAARGHDRAWLRVVASNTRAIKVYEIRGWQRFQRGDHEALGIAMIYLEKCRLSPHPVGRSSA
ncbi:MAG: GNAT family N-acetyltransferase [Pseudomonadota bacterium]